MVMQRRKGGTEVMSFAKSVDIYTFEFNTSGGAVTALVQDEAVVASVAYTSAGLYAVTLNQRFQRINGFANAGKAAAGWKAQITDIVDGGAAANTLNVRVSNASDAAADADALISVLLILTTADAGRVT